MLELQTLLAWRIFAFSKSYIIKHNSTLQACLFNIHETKLRFTSIWLNILWALDKCSHWILHKLSKHFSLDILDIILHNYLVALCGTVYHISVTHLWFGIPHIQGTLWLFTLNSSTSNCKLYHNFLIRTLFFGKRPSRSYLVMLWAHGSHCKGWNDVMYVCVREASLQWVFLKVEARVNHYNCGIV